MNLAPSQQNKIENIAKFLDDSNIATVESFMELDEKVTGLEEKIDAIKTPKELAKEIALNQKTSNFPCNSA